MREAVEERGRQLLVAGKHGDPFGEGEVARDHGRSSLIPIGKEIKEQFAADAIEGHKPQFVDLCGASHKSTNATPAVM